MEKTHAGRHLSMRADVNRAAELLRRAQVTALEDDALHRVYGADLMAAAAKCGEILDRCHREGARG